MLLDVTTEKETATGKIFGHFCLLLVKFVD